MDKEEKSNFQITEHLELTTEIVSTYASNNKLSIDELHTLIGSVHNTIINLEKKSAPTEKQKPAVPISRSVTDEYVICLEDGAKLKMLKRYIRTRFNLSPDEYRKKWGLPSDYPMVAPEYTKRRSSLAKNIGLGKDKGKRTG